MNTTSRPASYRVDPNAYTETLTTSTDSTLDSVAQWRRTLLDTTLQLTVPLRINELREQPVDRLLAMAHEAAETIATHGDDLQYGGPHCREAHAALTTGLAITALVALGGVRWHGLHWCRTPGCTTPYDVDAHPQPYPDMAKPSAPRRPVVSLPDLAAWSPGV